METIKPPREYCMLRHITNLGYMLRRSKISETVTLIPHRNCRGLIGDGTKLFANEAALVFWLSTQDASL